MIFRSDKHEAYPVGTRLQFIRGHQLLEGEVKSFYDACYRLVNITDSDGNPVEDMSFAMTNFWEVREAPKVQKTTKGRYDTHGLDTQEMVCFYEQDFYVLSNFSSFQIEVTGTDWRTFQDLSLSIPLLGHYYWAGLSMNFATSEHLYHWLRFSWSFKTSPIKSIRHTKSAHEAFKLAQANKQYQYPEWDKVKEACMYEILKLKWQQHPYVQKKLKDSGDRLLVENSYRDDYWGWGPNKDGKNALGKLWMKLRDEVNQGKINPI